MGFLDDDKEYIDGIKEASQWGTAAYLRKLFATSLFSNQLGRPEVVWDNTWRFLSDDILHRQRLLLRCEEIENLLRSNNRSLSEFSSMPYPDMSLLTHSQNRLIYDELNYDREMLAAQHSEYMSRLNNEQREVYDKIMSSIENRHGKIFFFYGYGGTGKTFLWRTLSTAIRSKGEIVLTVASSGIASLVLPGGRTAHSRFAIPININEDSTCNIKQGNSECEVKKAREFSEWILRVGDGRIGEPNDGEVCIDIPDEFLINGSNDPIGSLVDITYPSFLENMSIDGYLQHRAILAPTNEIVERINDYMLALVPGEMKTFLSFDSPCTMGGEWEERLIRFLFGWEIFEQILQIPRNRAVEMDYWSWLPDAKGVFSVKSYYRVAMEDKWQNISLTPGLNVDAEGTFWKKMWKLPILPRYKNFFWRACLDILPTASALTRRGV
ncbi:PIF1-like helicase [Senna tora]|uniref:ATP-dependent DNA helicase n=1 Tax=Senna tora TaxID=362788 RepID=A0A834T460_9FABA|nr:PIF1-like helicase [Senna tora]